MSKFSQNGCHTFTMGISISNSNKASKEFYFYKWHFIQGMTAQCFVVLATITNINIWSLPRALLNSPEVTIKTLLQQRSYREHVGLPRCFNSSIVLAVLQSEDLVMAADRRIWKSVKYRVTKSSVRLKCKVHKFWPVCHASHTLPAKGVACATRCDLRDSLVTSQIYLRKVRLVTLGSILGLFYLRRSYLNVPIKL